MHVRCMILHIQSLGHTVDTSLVPAKGVHKGQRKLLRRSVLCLERLSNDLESKNMLNTECDTWSKRVTLIYDYVVHQ